VEAGEFVEWEEIYGNYYGTLKREVDRALESGRHIIFDIDVKGGLSVKKRYPEALLIFIRPPDIEVLRERLRNRRTEDETTFARRLERVPMELAMGDAFDVQVVNDDLDRAIGEVQESVYHHIHQS